MKETISLIELGKRVKQSYPEYNHLSDELVGRTTLTEYPEYLNELNVVDLDGRFIKADEIAREIDSKHSMKRGMLGNWFQKKKSENRGSLLGQLTAEKTQVAESLKAQTELELAKANHLAAPERFRREVEAERIEHAMRELNYDNAQAVWAEATKEKIPVEVYAQIKTQQALHELELKKLEQTNRINREHEALKKRVDEEHKRMMGDIDLDHERQKAQDEIQANFVFRYMEIPQQITMLQNQIDQMYKEMGELTVEGKIGWADKVNDRRETVKALKEAQDGLRQELRQGNKQEEVGGAGQNTQDPGDPR